MDIQTYIDIAIEISHETIDFNKYMFGDEDEDIDYGTVSNFMLQI